VPLNGRSTSTKIPPSGKISYEEFLEWADEDTHAEWVDGEIIMPSPASFKHQNIMLFLGEMLKTYALIHDLGQVILPFQMKLPDSGPGREPDLTFVKKEHLARIQNTFLDGTADLAVEIVSPESVQRDRETKFNEYEVAGVPEYWLIDPLESKATFYQLNENNKYQSVPLDGEGRYFSQVLKDFWIKPEWLWRKNLPSVHAVLKKVGGKAY
jgi:Uma2 family endonuclease